MEVKGSEETRNLMEKILVMENDKMPELCTMSNCKYTVIENIKKLNEKENFENIFISIVDSSHIKKSVGKNLCSTVSNPTTCADKKSIIVEKSKEKFQPIPLHLTQGNVRFILSKEPLQTVQINQKILQVFILHY